MPYYLNNPFSDASRRGAPENHLNEVPILDGVYDEPDPDYTSRYFLAATRFVSAEEAALQRAAEDAEFARRCGPVKIIRPATGR